MATLAAQAKFGVYSPASFGWAERDPTRDSSLLVPLTHSGVAFGSTHRDAAGLFAAVLDELVLLIPGGLVAGQCGCYNPDSVTVGGDRSFHTWGIAIDVNWGSNPMYQKDRPTGLHAVPPAAGEIARRYGCEWGGDWTYPQDWMHIECHLPPAVARTVQRGQHGTSGGATPIIPTTPTAPTIPDMEDDMLDLLVTKKGVQALAIHYVSGQRSKVVQEGERQALEAIGVPTKAIDPALYDLLRKGATV